ncbi:hypothetical protein HY793_03825 [Candidatus Desantisbacteria bacterium]|nr:hypothetical protein [Candidatus Desantisbacteria bacterium]
MIALKDEITMELEKIPQDKFAEIYDVIHFFRLGVENERKVTTRKEWGQAFKKMHEYKEDQIIIDDTVDLEMEGWEWK